MSHIILYSLLVMTASLIGVISVWRSVGHIIERNLRYLVSFSAGVFLIISWNLGQEAIAHASSTFEGVGWIAVGAIALFVVFTLLPSFHHHHDDSEDGRHDRLDARHIITGDAIHNVGDGILLATAFAAHPALGALTAVSVFIHELVQEISEFFVLRQAGYSTPKALGINFAVSSTILLGAVGGFALIENVAVFEVPLLGIAAGSFLVVVIYDLIPHSVRTSQAKTHTLYHTLAFVIGVLIMGLVNTATLHTHEIMPHDHQELPGDQHHHVGENAHSDTESHH